MRALVKGGAQGICAGICQMLARAGDAVSIVDLQVNKAQLALISD
jgi:NAD(P)-dependent dehydrogenase (short-subunit alcohol dehydrogenase family)